jgi:SulP family sulfate permease
VLDAVAISDIDFTGARALSQVLDELERSHVVLAVARAVGGAPENLAHSGLLERIGRDHLFPSVDEAVVALGPGTTAASETPPPR